MSLLDKYLMLGRVVDNFSYVEFIISMKTYRYILMTKFFNYLCYVSVFKTLRNMEPMISFREIFILIWTRYNIDWHFVKKMLIVGKLFISVDGISFKWFFCGNFSFIQAIWCLNQAASILTIHKRWYTELLIIAGQLLLVVLPLMLQSQCCSQNCELYYCA